MSEPDDHEKVFLASFERNVSRAILDLDRRLKENSRHQAAHIDRIYFENHAAEPETLEKYGKTVIDLSRSAASIPRPANQLGKTNAVRAEVARKLGLDPGFEDDPPVYGRGPWTDAVRSQVVRKLMDLEKAVEDDQLNSAMERAAGHCNLSSQESQKIRNELARLAAPWSGFSIRGIDEAVAQLDKMLAQAFLDGTEHGQQ